MINYANEIVNFKGCLSCALSKRNLFYHVDWLMKMTDLYYHKIGNYQ